LIKNLKRLVERERGEGIYQSSYEEVGIEIQVEGSSDLFLRLPFSQELFN